MQVLNGNYDNILLVWREIILNCWCMQNCDFKITANQREGKVALTKIVWMRDF